MAFANLSSQNSRLLQKISILFKPFRYILTQPLQHPKREPLLDELTADEFDVFERECVRIASDWLTILKQKSEALLTSTTPLEPISVNIK
jgi:hypothetical protein